MTTNESVQDKNTRALCVECKTNEVEMAEFGDMRGESLWCATCKAKLIEATKGNEKTDADCEIACCVELATNPIRLNIGVIPLCEVHANALVLMLAKLTNVPASVIEDGFRRGELPDTIAVLRAALDYVESGAELVAGFTAGH